MNRSFCVVLLLVLSSCASMRQREMYAHSPNEIADHPEILYNGSVPREQMLLWGVKLGDPEAAIKASRVHERTKAGWIICRDGARYRIEKGIILTLGVWDSNILNKLAMTSPAAIEKQFGKPEKVDDAEPAKIYRYAGGKVTVVWNTREMQVNAVNVSN